MLLLALFLSLTPAPAQETASRTASLLVGDDYPANALQNGWEGDVVVDLSISKAGRARACWIIQSSGYRELDLKTCEVMLVRARFAPAKDQFGDPVEDRFRTPKIRWRIEK